MRALLLLAPLLAAGCAADAADEGDGGWEVGAFERVEGTRHLRAPLRPTGGRVRGDYSSGRGGYGPAANVLFYDLDGRRGRWLFPAGARAVVSDQAVRDSGRVRAFVYAVAEEDTDGDGRIDGDDAWTLAASDAEGRRLVRLAEGVAEARPPVRLDDDTVLVLFDAAGGVGGVELNLDDLSVEARVSMPRPPRPGPG